MKIIRWLISHSFLILLIVVVIYGYMFWGNLLGKDTPAGKTVVYLSDEFVAVKDFVNAVKAKQARLNGERPSETTAQISDQISGHTSGQQALAEPEPVTLKTVLRKETNQYAAQQAAQQPLQQRDSVSDVQLVGNNVTQENQLSQADDQSENITNSSTTERLADTDASAREVVAKTNVDQARNNQGHGSNGQHSAEQAFVSSEVEKQLGSVDKQGRVIDASQKVNEIEVDWIIARKSFYQRNYDLSEKSYLKVIGNTDDNFDAYGELGNVYFNQGKNEQAASAYFEAATILVRKGQVNRARSLMGLLRHLDKTKAGELQQLINSAKSLMPLT